jgi:hypothetical protein
MDTSKPEDGAVIFDLRDQMKKLETRLMAFESHGKGSSIRGILDFADIDESVVQIEETELPRHVSYLPKVRKCNFMEFKNRFCQEDARYAVDVLVSGDLFEKEYMEEKRFREKLFEHGKTDPRAARRKVQARVKETESSGTLRKAQSDRTWIRRIRLQAPSLLKILAKVQGESWSNRPRTYDRPFCTLIHFQPQVKQALAELEDKWTTYDEEQQPQSPISPKIPLEIEDDEDLLDDSRATLAILRAYVEFMDMEIIPETHRFDKLDYPIQDTISKESKLGVVLIIGWERESGEYSSSKKSTKASVYSY